MRGDFEEVQRLVRETLRTMGVTDDQLREVETQLREQMSRLGTDLPEGFPGLFGGPAEPPSDDGPDPRYPDDLPPPPVDPRPDEPKN